MLLVGMVNFAPNHKYSQGRREAKYFCMITYNDCNKASRRSDISCVGEYIRDS
jgi:hypothetical protein